MVAEPLHEVWTTVDSVLAHFIQLLHCRLLMRFSMYLVKRVEIWFNFLHVPVHIKHGILPLVVYNKM
jgi:hypothetical protein